MQAETPLLLSSLLLLHPPEVGNQYGSFHGRGFQNFPWGKDGQSSEKLEKALQITTEYRAMNIHTTTDFHVEANMYI